MLAFLPGLYLLPTSHAQAPAFPPPSQMFPVPTSESLTYAVDWRVFPAGAASFHLKAEGPNEHVTATAASIGTVNLLFPVADRYDSVFDRHTGCSSEYRKQIQEGRRRLTGLMQLDYTHCKKKPQRDPNPSRDPFPLLIKILLGVFFTHADFDGPSRSCCAASRTSSTVIVNRPASGSLLRLWSRLLAGCRNTRARVP